jgi:hypothetical protein
MEEDEEIFFSMLNMRMSRTPTRVQKKNSRAMAPRKIRVGQGARGLGAHWQAGVRCGPERAAGPTRALAGARALQWRLLIRHLPLGRRSDVPRGEYGRHCRQATWVPYHTVAGAQFRRRQTMSVTVAPHDRSESE